MVKQYPYQLWALLSGGIAVGTDSEQDDNGNFVMNSPNSGVAGAATWANLGQCRDEANPQIRSITLADSTYYRYESVIQLPKATPAVAVGTSVEVRAADGTVRVKGICRRFDTAQLHCQLWV